MTSKKTPHKYVYLFGEVEEVLARVDGDWEALRGLLGGKGINLFDATSLGIPVPPGFTVTTEACNDYLAAKQKFPKGMWNQVLEAVTELEKITGKRFGKPDNPLLVSCRSGAK
ncbi:MAG: PEP/pyruvate-binding domain-containing protein, partial [Lysobacterales bacterium]